MNTAIDIDRLILFDAIRGDEIVRAISLFARGQNNDSQNELFLETYSRVQRALLDGIGRSEISGNYLQDHICRLIAGEENVFAHMAEKGVYNKLKCGMSAVQVESSIDMEAGHILRLAAGEIKTLQAVYRFDFKKAIGRLTSENDIANLAATPENRISRREQLHKAMMRSNRLDAAILLARYYHNYGSGIFEAAPALNAEEYGLVPIKDTDPVTMDDLIGYEKQKRLLIDNTNALLSGMSANNVLLYGDSGTGKSSSVKALLNMYSHKGLKMISVSKDNLRLLPKILEQLELRGMKFIIFIDDLSFEENDYEYKVFKSVIEGRVAPRPKNVIFIVTTNRKNIVKENWSDREGGNDVRQRDNIQEKRSLSDRFGITLVYSEPDKQEYLAIVHSLAARQGLCIKDDELSAEALKWEIRHGGRSGRTAQQFVDYMIGVQMVNRGERDI